MGRPLRSHEAGAVYHIMSRGNDGQDIFLDSADYRRFLGLLSELKRRHGIRILAYCLMPNHFHLLPRVGAVPIWVTMQQLLTRYANHFNFKHDRRGHLFQSRYKAIPCVSDTYLLELLRYIHLNPVRAGLVRRPEEWPWSGHLAYLRGNPDSIADSQFLLAVFSDDPARARWAYAIFMASARDSKPELQSDSLPDSASWSPAIRQDAEGVSQTPTLGQIAEALCVKNAARVSDLVSRSQSRQNVELRRIFVRRSMEAGH
jgi:REP element-mobilizing transposase RayT